MLKKRYLSLIIVFVAGNATAACIRDTGSPHTFTIPAQTIVIDADRAVDTTNPVLRVDSAPQGEELSYTNCVNGELYGRSIANLTNQDGSTKIFPTNVPGIGIKVLTTTRGTTMLNFPASGPMQTEDGKEYTRFVYPATSFFRIELYKTQPTLTLSNPSGDIVLPAEKIAYTWVTADNPASFSQQLNIGQITIVSTPSCTYDNAKTVDFGTVTTNTLTNAGISRDLKFSLICKTDYGSYSASASITSETATPDSKYIKVKDAAGNQDRLAIKITDSKNADMMLDGSTIEKVTNVSHNVPAEFNWHATLYPAGDGRLPESGNFTAQAEILLQVK